VEKEKEPINLHSRLVRTILSMQEILEQLSAMQERQKGVPAFRRIELPSGRWVVYVVDYTFRQSSSLLYQVIRPPSVMRSVHRDWISYLERQLFAARFAARRWVFYYLCREGSVQAEAALRLYLLLLLLMLMLCVGDIGKSDVKKCPPPAHTFVSEKCRGEFELGVARALVKTFHSLVLLTVYYLPLSIVIGKTETHSIPGTFALLFPQPVPFYHASSTQMAIHMLLFCSKAPVT